MRFQGDVDEELICPICAGVLEEPLQAAACEHAFCRACITEWLSRQPTCPVDRNNITTTNLRPVPRILKNLLARLVCALICRLVCDILAPQPSHFDWNSTIFATFHLQTEHNVRQFRLWMHTSTQIRRARQSSGGVRAQSEETVAMWTRLRLDHTQRWVQRPQLHPWATCRYSFPAAEAGRHEKWA